jgi:glutamate racemase
MAKVGIFDSGLGGLLTARLLHALRPGAEILYYGDTAHLPYGDKSPEQIRGYVREIVAFLREAGAEVIVVACNTASAVALETVREAAGSLPVYDAISPALEAFGGKAYPAPVGIIGTYMTIRSGVYGAALRSWGYEVRELATPVLVPLIEEGWIEHPATEAALETYLGQLGAIHTLLLACTHYPLLEGAIRRYYTRMGWEVQVLSTAALLAEAVASHLPLAEAPSAGLSCWVSDPNPRFVEIAKHFWGASVEIRPVPASLRSV